VLPGRPESIASGIAAGVGDASGSGEGARDADAPTPDPRALAAGGPAIDLDTDGYRRVKEAVVER
jgi:hypothetical protein